MLPPDEVLLASNEEVEAEIKSLLQDAESFAISFDKGWHGEILAGDEVVWWGGGFDYRLVLLDAYGWLWMRAHPPKRGLRWGDRPELTREMVTQRAQRQASAKDPEDLDPDEIAAVYEDYRKKD